jgi:hypothetical protein
MRRVLEGQEFIGRKHGGVQLSAAAFRDLLAIFRVPNFPAQRGELVAQFITFPPFLGKPRLRARFARAVIFAGTLASSPVMASTLSILFHHSSHPFAVGAASAPESSGAVRVRMDSKR